MNNGAEFGQAAYWAVAEATSAPAGRIEVAGVVEDEGGASTTVRELVASELVLSVVVASWMTGGGRRAAGDSRSLGGLYPRPDREPSLHVDRARLLPLLVRFSSGRWRLKGYDAVIRGAPACRL